MDEKPSEKSSEQSSVETPAQKPWQFKKGNNANPHGRSGKPLEPTRGSLFLDMEAVYNQLPSEDRTAGEKNCRKWLEDNPKEFLREFSKLRELELAAQRPAEIPEGKDERQEKIEDLIDGILGDLAREQAKEDAELAKRPNAAEIGGSLQKSLKGALEREEQLRRQVDVDCALR